DTVDTCFALFFLRRANLAVDLTATLKDRVRDPAVVNLKASGRGETRPKEKPGSATDSAKKPNAADRQRHSRLKLEPPEAETQQTHAPAPKSAPAREVPARGEKQNDEVIRLRDQLVRASTSDQLRLLERLRDQKGAIHTDALAAAIPLLKGAV